MNPRVTAILTILVMSLALVGCLGGKVKYPTYYTLQVPPPPDLPLNGTTRPTLAVRQFTAPGYLRQGAIVYRVSPEQIGFYDYHRWATDPRDFVTNALIARLRAGNAFDGVKPYDGRSDVDYILTGRLEKLEELDYGNSVRVEVAMSAQITNLKTGATVWSNEVDQVEVVEPRSVAGVVSSMNRAMERSIEDLMSPARLAQVAH